MPATARRGSGRRSSPAREVLVSGPYKGVKNTTDPFDDTPEFLLDLVNGYIPDTEGGSGAYARPGFLLLNSSNQLGGSNHMGEGVWQHTALDTTEYRFEVVSGKIYRVSADGSSYIDVTPGTVTIDGSLGTRVFMLSFADKLIVSDGVNQPWYGTNLSATPITGTKIQYDSGNSAWSAQHMTLYSGALVFLLNKVAGVFVRNTIAWSAPNDPTQGYFNVVSSVAVDYTWILSQTGSSPIYALCGTNIALLYWRDDSIGALTGAIGPNFKNSSTHDAIDLKSGTRSPATIALHGNTVFYADTFGRPMMLPLGGKPIDIWLNMRSVVESARTDVPQVTAITAVGVIEPNLKLYLVAVWSPLPTINLAPSTIHAFDVKTGMYVGRWLVGPGVNIETMGILRDSYGNPHLIVIGSKVAATANGFGGYVWQLTHPNSNVWTDNGDVPTIQAQTQRLGFSVDRVKYAERATAITGSDAPCGIRVLTPALLVQGFTTDDLSTEAALLLVTEDGIQLDVETYAQATATPTAPTIDGTYRVPWGLDAQGRGFNLTIFPTTATSQWRIHKVELTTVESNAPVEES